MPIAYEITDGGRFVVTRATGTVTEEDLLTYQAALLSDARVRPGFDELFDGTMARGVELSEGVLDKMAAVDDAHAAKLAGGRCAVVVRSDFGLAEQFEHRPGRPHEVMVFFNLDVARTWLGRQGQAERDARTPTS